MAAVTGKKTHPSDSGGCVASYASLCGPAGTTTGPMRASAPTGFRHPRKGRHTGRPLRADGQRVAAAQPLAARPLTDAAYPLRVKRNARKEKLVKCVLAPRRPARDGSCKLAEDHSVPEGRAKSALAPIRRPPYSAEARTCRSASRRFFSSTGRGAFSF